MSFDDLLQANQRYASTFAYPDYPGRAQAGVLILTCMDSRIDPLEVFGLQHGDAKVLRSPGGHLSEAMLAGSIVGAHLLGVERIVVMVHTKCAMATGTDKDVRRRIFEGSGVDASWLDFGATPDQLDRLEHDVTILRNHPLIAGRAEVGGFRYDVDTGAVEQLL